MVKSNTSNFQKYNTVLKELISLSNQEFDSLDDTFLAYIQFGVDKTGFTTGVVSEIKGSEYTVLQTITQKEGLNKGLVVDLCDTLCHTVYKTGETLFCPKIKGTDFHGLFTQSFLNIQAAICIPLFVNNKVFGTINFSSEEEIENSEEWEFLHSLMELLGQSLSKLIKESILQESLEEEKKLLEMGSDLLQMATYKRYIDTNDIVSTNNFYNLFDLDEELKNGKINPKDIYNKVFFKDKGLGLGKVEKSKTEDLPPFEYRIVKKDGSIRWLRHQVKNQKDKGYVLGIIQDITTLKDSLLKLEEKNKELEQFAYAAAHDLQEPLRTITGFSELLSTLYESTIDQTGKEYLSYLGKASNRMKEQIDGLLTHSRIGRSGDVHEIDLNIILKEILQDFEYEIKESKAAISSKPLPTINGYIIEQRMLWQNFISNGIKFRRKGFAPIINIDHHESTDFWHFTIEDNGIGMSEDNTNKIFDLFARLNPREEYEGTGIGLTHCKKIINLHGGEIKVYSQVDVGTKIEFSIKK